MCTRALTHTHTHSFYHLIFKRAFEYQKEEGRHLRRKPSPANSVHLDLHTAHCAVLFWFCQGQGADAGIEDGCSETASSLTLPFSYRGEKLRPRGLSAGRGTAKHGSTGLDPGLASRQAPTGRRTPGKILHPPQPSREIWEQNSPPGSPQ